jgi:hypothetical protein
MHTYLVVASLLWFAQDAKEPDDVLNKLTSDLQGALKKAPTDADVRGKMVAAAKAIFDKEIATSAVKMAKPIWDWQSRYLESLVVADKKFGGAEQKNERSTYVAGCKAAFNRQILVYKEESIEEDKAPTADDVYTSLATAISKAKGTFTDDASDDLRLAAYGGANEIFAKMIAKARPTGRDPQKWYEEQLVKIDRDYPMTTEKQKKWNASANAALKTAAKSAFDRSIKK